jgi:hypothetical protein
MVTVISDRMMGLPVDTSRWTALFGNLSGFHVRYPRTSRSGPAPPGTRLARVISWPGLELGRTIESRLAPEAVGPAR